MTVLESIVKDLEKLPASKLLEVVRFVHQLDPDRAERRRAALEATLDASLERKEKLSRRQ